MKLYFLILILSIFCGNISAFAGPLFGAEFTFTNIDIIDQSEIESSDDSYSLEVEYQKRLKKKLVNECLAKKTCDAEEVLDSFGRKAYKVHFPKDDFWIQITTDPGVVEVQTKPMDYDGYVKVKPHLDQLFQSAESVGISPHPRRGGGHIHMDLKTAFNDDPMLFRNFLVDFMNHDELGGLGVFGSDNSNAPHLKRLGSKHVAAFNQVIADFDSGKIKDIKGLIEAMNVRVYTSNPAKWVPYSKYQALNLLRGLFADGLSTVEFRAISAQRSPEEFLKIIKLFEARIEYLKTLKTPLKFMPFQVLDKVASFKSYIEESKLKWKDYYTIGRTPGTSEPLVDLMESCAEDFARLPDMQR